MISTSLGLVSAMFFECLKDLPSPFSIVRNYTKDKHHHVRITFLSLWFVIVVRIFWRGKATYRYIGSCVARQAKNKDSTVSGLKMFLASNGGDDLEV